MSGNLLDTNVIVKVLRGDPEAIGFLNSLGTDVFTSAVVIGELLYGANKSVKAEQNRQLVREKTESLEVLPIDIETAEVYGQIKDQLAKEGRNIPENDLWIAATAKKHGLALVTLDSHFKYVSGLAVLGF
ncbi:MAG: type II toxin-antitoxin system VapC family toxin [Clostridiales bacterium]|nr:type II toxin-antitoxin system VapC family toxin [Clostridiales bacterium]